MCETPEIEVTEKARDAIERAFEDWFTENDYLWSAGVTVDVVSLRSRLNAAAANSCSS